jgi:hypothetical protein
VVFSLPHWDAGMDIILKAGSIMPGKPAVGKFGGGLNGSQALVLYPSYPKEAAAMASGMKRAYWNHPRYMKAFASRGCANYLEPLFGPVPDSWQRKSRIIHPENIGTVLGWLPDAEL